MSVARQFLDARLAPAPVAQSTGCLAQNGPAIDYHCGRNIVLDRSSPRPHSLLMPARRAPGDAKEILCRGGDPVPPDVGPTSSCMMANIVHSSRAKFLYTSLFGKLSIHSAPGELSRTRSLAVTARFGEGGAHVSSTTVHVHWLPARSRIHDASQSEGSEERIAPGGEHFARHGDGAWL